MPAPTIIYRKLDANGDPLWGNGTSSFVTDISAVGQSILTRLRLLQGEWWENLGAGTPLFQQMLGQTGTRSKTQAISAVLQRRVRGSPYVTGLTQVQASFDPSSRSFGFSCASITQFGTLIVTWTPTGSSVSLDT